MFNVNRPYNLYNESMYFHSFRVRFFYIIVLFCYSVPVRSISICANCFYDGTI